MKRFEKELTEIIEVSGEQFAEIVDLLQGIADVLSMPHEDREEVDKPLLH